MVQPDSLHGCILISLGAATGALAVGWVLEQPWGWAYLMSGVVLLAIVGEITRKRVSK